MAMMPSWYKPHGPAYITTRSLTHLAPPQVVVPEEFPFNVSVPWWARWLVSPHDPELLRAAAFHDYAILKMGWSRTTAAGLWNDVLRDEGKVSAFWRALSFLVLGLWRWR